MKTREQLIKEIIYVEIEKAAEGEYAVTVDAVAERLEFLGYEAILREWEEAVEYAE